MPLGAGLCVRVSAIVGSNCGQLHGTPERTCARVRFHLAERSRSRSRSAVSSGNLRLPRGFGLRRRSSVLVFYFRILAVMSRLSVTLRWLNRYLASRCRGHTRT